MDLGPPYPRALRLGPRAFSISVVNSMSWSFVGGATTAVSIINSECFEIVNARNYPNENDK